MKYDGFFEKISNKFYCFRKLDKKFRKINLNFSFVNIKIFTENYHNDFFLKEEILKLKDEFNSVLLTKRSEVNGIKKKYNDIRNELQTFKNKENENLNKLKDKEKKIGILESQLLDSFRQKRSQSNDDTNKLKYLEKKVLFI